MRIGPFDLRLGKKVDIEKQSNDERITDLLYTSYRPTMELIQTLGTEGVRVPWFPLPLKTLYDVAYYSDILRNIIHALKTELFRHGFEIEEKFVQKCLNCGKEFMHQVEICDVCKTSNFREPDVRQKYMLEKFILDVNENDQSLIDVSQMIEDDLEIVDDGYLIALKDYYWDETTGELLGSNVIEVLRGHPMFLNIIADKTGRPGRNEAGEIVYTCVNHRDQVWYGKEQQVCSKCGRKLFQAMFKATGVEGKSIYYIKGEVCHRSKYMKSLTYGHSPILAVWQKVVTLVAQDKFMKDYYVKQRPPRGLLFVNTPNITSLEKAWNWMLDMWKKNPHMVPPIAVETPNAGRRFVEFVDFMKTLEEMQFIEGREEFRRAIGAVYGVMPLFTGESTTGMRNEGLQITVTSRAIENGQSVFDDGFYSFLLEQLGVTDYLLKLVKPEYRDELTVEQIKAQKIANAQSMRNMGFEVILNEEGEFEFVQKPTIPTETPATSTETPSEATETQTPKTPEEQRFEGEPPHIHESDSQRFSGETFDVAREDLKKKFIEKQLEEDYRYYLSQHGESAQAVGWKSEKDQLNRFDIVSNFFEEDNPQVMDVGAGLGHFYTYLTEEGFTPIYEGIDIMPEFVERARANGINVRQLDVINLDKNYDYVVALGTFAFTKQDLPKIPNPWEHTKERIKVMFDKANKMALVTLLIKKPYPEYIVFNQEQIEEFAKTLTPSYEIITSKEDDRITNDEIILVLYKQSIKGDAPVTTTGGSVYYPRYSPANRKRKIRNIFVGKLTEINKEYKLKQEDEKELDFIADNIYEYTFEGLSKKTSERIKDYILNAYDRGIGLIVITDFIKRLTGLSPEKSNVIATTELTALENKAREWTYNKTDPEMIEKYRWIGPDDDRTTDICRSIKRRTFKGVSLDELKKVVNEEGKKGGFEPRDFMPHIGCRHTFVRI